MPHFRHRALTVPCKMGVIKLCLRRRYIIWAVICTLGLVWLMNRETQNFTQEMKLNSEQQPGEFQLENFRKAWSNMRFKDFGVSNALDEEMELDESDVPNGEIIDPLAARDKPAFNEQVDHIVPSRNRLIPDSLDKEPHEKDVDAQMAEDDNNSDVEAKFIDGRYGNYEPSYLTKVYGRGEGGKGISVIEKDEASLRLYGCDMSVSDLIPINRTLADFRDPECKFWTYPSNLPIASVVIVFYNEGFSTLMRTVYSVINRSPTSLLAEVVLVDDASTMDHLKEPLQIHIMRFQGKVKLYRNAKRMGIVGARMRGIKEAVGDAVVVLDSHCECNINWLPPLLQRIALNRKTLAVPVVDMIDHQTFEYSPMRSMRKKKGAFDWGLLYKHIYLTDEELAAKRYDTEPHVSPTHGGGLFAVNREYFLYIGGYDPHLQVWGGENMQLSFKIWMCGGKIEIVPCSRVGHVYHTHIPYGLEPDPAEGIKIPSIRYNYIRVAEGWMDEYKENFYLREPDLRGYSVSVDDQRNLRTRLQCHTFAWYMQNVAKELINYFPLLKQNIAWGMLHIHNETQCMWRDGESVLVLPCQGREDQIFRRNTAGQLANGEFCVAAHTTTEVKAVRCNSPDNEPWIWRDDTHQIQYPSNSNCLTATPSNRVILKRCEEQNNQQKWEFVEHKAWSLGE